MDKIGLYEQLTSFSTENAGTAEWCKAERNGTEYFVKKFHSPVYPSKDIGLPEKMYKAGIEEFHSSLSKKRELYQRLRNCDQSGVLVIPLEVINYQFHICTISDYIVGNVAPEDICCLSEWQRLVLMRTLTLALMNVHKTGIVHSDMKPENVLVTQDEKGHCKLRLIDFDGSFFESDPPMDSEDVAGDPAFFSPEAYEQSMDEDIRLDHRIDIFALGLIFHYFWSGKYPGRPENQTIGETVLKNQDITMDDSVPLVLKQLIQKMILRDPDKRISLKSVYDVLGVQIGLYPQVIINLQTARPSPKDAPSSKNRRDITINYCDESGKVLRSTILHMPYGTKKIVNALDIYGYELVGPARKEIRVRADGRAETPVVFKYRKEKADTSGRTLAVIYAILILSLLGLIYLYLKGTHQI